MCWRLKRYISGYFGVLFCFIIALAFRDVTMTQENLAEEILRLKNLQQGQYDVEREAEKIRQVRPHREMLGPTKNTQFFMIHFLAGRNLMRTTKQRKKKKKN